MSLVSHLLKSLIIKESTNREWVFCVARQKPDVNSGKPYYVSMPGETEVSFNVSHQAGTVALIALSGSSANEYDVGIDVVCVSERNEAEKILDGDDGSERREEWENRFNDFIDMHAEVFAPSEIAALKAPQGNESQGAGGRDGKALATVEEIVNAKLRRFYALWCLREAYVKMTGDALLADWLRELEIRKFGVPGDGEEMENNETWFKGKKLEDVRMIIVGAGSSYMVASAVRRKDRREWEGGWREMEDLSVEEVVKRAKVQG